MSVHSHGGVQQLEVEASLKTAESESSIIDRKAVSWAGERAVVCCSYLVSDEEHINESYL